MTTNQHQLNSKFGIFVYFDVQFLRMLYFLEIVEINVTHFLSLFCRPCILIFDSLHSGSRAKVAATLREYLACEYKAKMSHNGRERIFSKETFRGCCPKVPQQPNFSDCGLYLLQYIEAFFEVITK